MIRHNIGHPTHHVPQADAIDGVLDQHLGDEALQLRRDVGLIRQVQLLSAYFVVEGNYIVIMKRHFAIHQGE